MPDKKVYAGSYRRYDGNFIYVVSTAEDVETGAETVIYRQCGAIGVDRYFTVSKKYFCSLVKVAGKYKPRYTRMTVRKTYDMIASNVKEDGFRVPERKNPDKSFIIREYQTSKDYLSYAKDLCSNFKEDSSRYDSCMQARKYIGVPRSEFYKLKEDIGFMRTMQETSLAEYYDYFNDRFIEGMSIRRYAETHKLNRGSVEYENKKFLNMIASALKIRDVNDEKCRLDIDK